MFPVQKTNPGDVFWPRGWPLWLLHHAAFRLLHCCGDKSIALLHDLFSVWWPSSRVGPPGMKVCLCTFTMLSDSLDVHHAVSERRLIMTNTKYSPVRTIQNPHHSSKEPSAVPVPIMEDRKGKNVPLFWKQKPYTSSGSKNVHIFWKQCMAWKTMFEFCTWECTNCIHDKVWTENEQTISQCRPRKKTPQCRPKKNRLNCAKKTRLNCASGSTRTDHHWHHSRGLLRKWKFLKQFLPRVDDVVVLLALSAVVVPQVPSASAVSVWSVSVRPTHQSSRSRSTSAKEREKNDDDLIIIIRVSPHNAERCTQ